jgi:hypothetical protein
LNGSIKLASVDLNTMLQEVLTVGMPIARTLLGGDQICDDVSQFSLELHFVLQIKFITPFLEKRWLSQSKLLDMLYQLSISYV